LDDASKSNIWYSNFAGTKYAFQYNPLNFVDTGRDGQNMIKLIAFEKDLIGIKEASTGRLSSGNPDSQYQKLDERIGIGSKNMAAFIPSVGIAAITNDYGDFRIFGYDLRWTNILNGLDISLPMRSLTSALDSDLTSIIYVNGKIMVWDGSANALVLHVTEKRGWSFYDFPISSSSQKAFTFANNRRAAIVGSSMHLVEIEISGRNKDVNIDTDADVIITLVEITHCFQKNSGRNILEFESLSVCGLFPGDGFGSGDIRALPYANTINWPTPATPTSVNFARPPAAIGAGTFAGLGDTEYKLYLEPQTVGAFNWCPMVGNYLHFQLSIDSPAVMKSKELHCIVDENGIAWGAFDPFQSFTSTDVDPGWASQSS
jgi:hypothetical protein